MKISTKTSIIILGTLILGIVIGILGSGMLHQKRLERIQQMDPGQRFSEVLDKILKPDETQRRVIKDILKMQTQNIAQIEEEYQEAIFTIFDSTRLKIKSLLSADQLKNLENEMAKGQDHIISRRIEHMADLLQLNKEQRRQIEQIIRQSAPGMVSKRVLFFVEGRKNRAKVREMKEALDKKIESILTPEQIKIYREFNARRMPPLFK